MSMSDQAHQPPQQAMSWQDQLLDVLRARERTWFVAAVVLILLGALLALLAPGTLPPTPLVGLAVGAAGVLLATAVVIGLDVSDVIVRGPRHVEVAGGRVAGTISRSTADIDALVALIDAHDRDGKVRVALTPASRSAGVPGSRANIVAAELADRGAKVLVTDLTRGGTPAVGLSDVISGERSLGEAVRFDDELYLAHLAVGSEPELALEGFASWARGLPPDLDVLVAALPPLSEPGVLQAVAGVELVLLLVEVDRTERVDLVASLDAIDAADVPAELVLVDDATTPMPATGSGSVEVLSTPGSTPRQRDPDGFDLQTTRAAGGVTPIEAPEPVAPEATGTEDPGTEAPGSEDVGSEDVGSEDIGAEDVGAEAAGSEGRGDDWSSPAADADPTPHPAPDGPTIVDPFDQSAPGPADTDLRPSAAAAVDTPSPTTRLDPDDFEDDDGPATAPGGGHVRTIRRRAPGGDDTVAMPPVDPGEGGQATGRDIDSSSDAAPADPSRARDGGPGDDAPAVTPDVVSDREPSWPDAAVDEPGPERGDATGHGRDAHVDHGHGHDADDADGAAEDEDPIDVVAREQARLSASLQQLAQDVWQRGDGA